MKYLVCGAGGFIGGHLVKNLMDEGHEVVCADIKPLEFWFQIYEDNKNLSLDEQAYKQRKKTKNEAESSFHCFRCNIEKKSTIKYEWNTSEGVKVLCNGCNGNLTAMTKTL